MLDIYLLRIHIGFIQLPGGKHLFVLKYTAKYSKFLLMLL